MDTEFQQFKKEYQDTIIKLKGQIDNQEKQISDLKRESMSLFARKSDSETTKFVDIPFYPQLKVLKLIAGLPIYNSTTSLITTSGLRSLNGQIFFIKTTTTTPRVMLGVAINNTVSRIALNPVRVYSTTVGLVGINGEMFLVNATGNTTPRRVVAFKVGNTVSSVALT